jgi:CBS domain-containing protein
MKVKDLMTKDVKCCADHNTLNTVAQVMWDHDIGCVPVVDNQGRVIGMLTDRDICMSAYMEGVPLAWLWATVAMSKEVFSCGADDDLTTAEKLMREKQVHRLPVLDVEKRPVGIISLHDVASEGWREAEMKKTRSVSDTEIAKLVASVGAPRHRVVEVQAASAPSPFASC